MYTDERFSPHALSQAGGSAAGRESVTRDIAAAVRMDLTGPSSAAFRQVVAVLNEMGHALVVTHEDDWTGALEMTAEPRQAEQFGLRLRMTLTVEASIITDEAESEPWPSPS